MSITKKTSLLSDYRFPAFIRGDSDYDGLRQFVKSYFESLETQGSANYELLNAMDNHDVDTVSTDFLDRFYNYLCPDLPSSIMADKRLLMKHSRELYEKKGTPESFKLLFTIMFNESINIKHPSENVLRASDGTWNQPIAIHVKFPGVSESTILGLVNKELTCINNTGIVRNVVLLVKKISDTTWEVQIDKQKNTRFAIGDVITVGTVSGTIVPCTSSIQIIKPGRKFKPGQVIKLSLDGGTGSLAKITNVDANGGITKIQIIKFGDGYSGDFSLTISPSLRTTTSTDSTISGGVLPVTETTNGFSEFGYIRQTGKLGPQFDYFLSDYTEPDYTAGIVRLFGGTQLPPNSTTGDETTLYAILSVNMGAVLSYPGFWRDNKGNLSDPTMVLQDNLLYQNFSYLIQSSVPRDKYVDTVKKLLHPAGMRMFSDLMLESHIDMSSQIANVDGMHIRLYTTDNIVADDEMHMALTLHKDDVVTAIEDVSKRTTYNFTDEVIANEGSSYMDHSYAAIDYVEDIPAVIKLTTSTKQDDVITTDFFGNNHQIVMSDSVVATDSVSQSTSISVSDSVTPLEVAAYADVGYAGSDYFAADPGLTITTA